MQHYNNISTTLKYALISVIFITINISYTVSVAQSRLTIKDVEYIYRVNLRSKITSANNLSDHSTRYIEMTPDWNNITKYNSQRYNVIEIPLHYHQDKIFKIMTEEVFRYVNGVKDKRVVPQKQRWIILQDKNNGALYSFIMHIIPSLNYTYNDIKRIDQNNYLKTEPHFDGMTLFYTTEGELINGWIYQKGRLMLGVLPKDSQSSNYSILSTYLKVCIYTLELNVDNRSMQEELGSICMSTYIPHDDPNDGKIDTSQIENTRIEDQFKYEVETKEKPKDDRYLLQEKFSEPTFTKKEEPQYNHPPVNKQTAPPHDNILSGRTDIHIGNTGPTKDKIRCSPLSIKYADRAMEILQSNPHIRNNIQSLQGYARNGDREYGMTINQRGKSFFIHNNEIRKGTRGEIRLSFNLETSMMIHTHHSSRNIKVTNFTGPSGNDIDNTLAAGYVIVQNRGKNYQGSVIIAYDTSEYLLVIDNMSKAIKFYARNRNAFSNTSSRVGSFQNEEFREQYRSVRERLEEVGYSNQDAHDYATCYLFDKFDVGMKLMKKEPQSTSFKELSVKYDSNTDMYYPQICE